MTLQGQVALVAGASRGIGADIAKHLAKAGANVAVAARVAALRAPLAPPSISKDAFEVIEGILREEMSIAIDDHGSPSQRPGLIQRKRQLRSPA